MLGLRASHGKKTVVLVEVEGTSAAVGIAILNPGDAVKIIAGERHVLPVAERAPGQAASGLSALLKETAEAVLKKYTEGDGAKTHGNPEEIHVVVGPPWTHSRTAHTETSFPEPHPVTKQAIESLAKEAVKQPSELNQQSLLETNVVRVQVNGYPTGKPIGKKGIQLGVTAYQSDIDAGVRQSIESTLGAVFPGRPIDMRSSVRALMNVLNEHVHIKNYILIAVGTESTECIAVRKDEIAEHASVPEGMTTLIRRVAGEQGLPEESLSLLRMVAADTCSAPQCDAIRTELAKAEPELAKLYGEAFNKLATARKLPNSCILLAHADLAPWLEHFFCRLDFSPFTTTTHPFKVESVAPEHLRSSVTWEPGVREDTGLGIAAAFANLRTSSA